MEEDTIRINVTVAGRTYSMRVKMEEEEYVRKGAELIDQKIRELQASYSVKDDKDLLAMSALQLATERSRSAGEEARGQDQGEIEEMEERIAQYLRNVDTQKE
ncbi:MAG: cell division protein ZapA [Flavobacteriales bacterium]